MLATLGNQRQLDLSKGGLSSKSVVYMWEIENKFVDKSFIFPDK
jgi:hypothetical protein